MSCTLRSQNFTFLLRYGEHLDRLGALAERYFSEDPNTCLIKLRQLAEELARQTAARNGLLTAPDEPQSDLLRRLKFEQAAPAEALDLFHHLRLVGNRAVHDALADYREALAALKVARALAIWFHRSFGRIEDFKPGPFIPPGPPSAAPDAVLNELATLRAERDRLLSDAEKAREAAEVERLAREDAEQRARRLAEERALWEELAQEAETQKNTVRADLLALQASAIQVAPQARIERQHRAERAAQGIDLDEAATRVLIDAQLRARGWEVDTPTLG